MYSCVNKGDFCAKRPNTSISITGNERYDWFYSSGSVSDYDLSGRAFHFAEQTGEKPMELA